MRSNCGATSLKKTRRTGNTMHDHDRQPRQLRQWLANAILPWHPKSARRAYDKALEKTGDVGRALRSLDAAQEKRIARDRSFVWGSGYPGATSGASTTGNAHETSRDKQPLCPSFNHKYPDTLDPQAQGLQRSITFPRTHKSVR